MKVTAETYSGKLKGGKPELLYSEGVEVSDPELTPEQKEIEAPKARVDVLEKAIKKQLSGKNSLP